MENTATKIKSKHTCGFCNSQINSASHKYCDHICKELSYLERKSLRLLEEKEFRELERSLNAIGFTLIKGGKYYSPEIEKRSGQFLIFCQSLFWNQQNFTEKEQSQFKSLITEHFMGSKDIDETFRNLIERAVLAKRYISQHPFRFVAEPKKWFNINYAYGLTGTESWFIELEAQRKTLPFYKISITLLAEALMEYFDSKDVQDILSYRQQFIKLEQSDLLQIYMNAIMHIQFFNS